MRTLISWIAISFLAIILALFIAWVFGSMKGIPMFFEKTPFHTTLVV